MGGIKNVTWTFLQQIRMSLFWTGEMKRKQNVGQVRRWLGKKILALQSAEYFFPKTNKKVIQY